MNMDNEDMCDGGDGCSAVHQAELSQSSGVLSLPSGNKLADISLTSDITDSDIEDEDTVLGYNKYDQLKGSDVKFDNCIKNTANDHKVCVVNGQQVNEIIAEAKQTSNITVQVSDSNVPSVSQCHSFPSVMQSASHSGQVRKHSSVSSGLSIEDVKEALQENGDLFTDQHFLDDLLRSLDIKMQQQIIADSKKHIVRTSRNILPNVKPNRDPGLNVSCKEYVKKTVAKVTDSEHYSLASQLVQEPFSFDQCPISNGFSSKCKYENIDGIQDVKRSVIHCNTSRRSPLVNGEDLPSCISNEEKHVKFEDSTVEYPVQDGASEGEGEQLQPLHTYSARSHNIIRHLSGMRWRLEGWEEISASPPAVGASSLSILQQLLQRLQASRLEKKHLDKDLSACRTALKELHRTRAVECGLHQEREARLVAVSRELEDLQKEWVVAQNTAVAQLTTLKDQCHQLKEEKGIMEKDVISLKSELARLREAVKDHGKLKINLEETEEQIATSRRQLIEIAEENSRVNLSLQEKEQQLKQLEEVRVPELVHEVEGARQEARKLNEANNQLLQAKRAVADELRILKLQHQALLAKVVAEEQEKETLFKEKAALECGVKQANEEVATLKKEIHQHYQGQMEALVAQKTAELQNQLTKLEQQMKTNLEEQIDAQRQSHHLACLAMQQKHDTQIQELERNHVEVLKGLKQALRKVEEENERLKEKQQGILSAVTSIMGFPHQDPSVLEASVTKDVGTTQKLAGTSLTVGSTTYQAKAPCSFSRPGSGRGMRGIPTIGLKSSSSSDSEGSVFVDGGQTVRHHAGGQSHAAITSSSCTISQFSQQKTVGVNRSVNLKQHCDDLHKCHSVKQFQSMPDLQSETSSDGKKTK